MMGESPNYYNADYYSNWKSKQTRRGPPRANFLAAASFVRNLFESKKINWATIGSLAMLCLGSGRHMPNMHIVYDDRDFERIKTKLEADRRVKLPKGMNTLFASRILIRTGPDYKDKGCTENLDVELILVPPGSNGTPPNDVLNKNQALLRLTHDGKMASFKGLNMIYMLKTTLAFSKEQDLPWDPKHDLVFLCLNYGKEIEAMAYRLDPKELDRVFFSSIFYSMLSTEEQRRCSMVLVGKEVLKSPPPKMAVIPPSTPVLERPALQSAKSTPYLRNSSQISSDLLSPPLPAKRKVSRSTPPVLGQAPVQPPPPQQQQQQRQLQPIPPNGTIPQGALTHSEPQKSRSRYRQTSAPSTPAHSRNPSMNLPEVLANNSRPKSMDNHVSSHQHAKVIPAQQFPNVTRPQIAPVHSRVSMIGPPGGFLPQKSVPNLRASTSGKPVVPVFGHSNTSPGFHNAHITPGPPLLPHALTSSNTKQPRASFYGAPERLPPSDKARQGTAINNDQTKGQVGGNTQTSSRPRHYHSNSAPGPEPSQSSGLRVVGPSGIYAATEKQHKPINAPQSQPDIDIQNSHCQEAPPISLPSMHDQHPFAVELPATAPTPAPTTSLPKQSPQVSPQQDHVAEYGAAGQLHSFQPPQTLPNSTLIAELPANSTPRPPHDPPVPTRPTHPRTISEPINSLPASLMAGVQGSRQRSSKHSISHPSAPLHPDPDPIISSNANRYTQLFTSGHHASNHALVSQYKAYSGPASPPAPAPLHHPTTPPFTPATQTLTSSMQNLSLSTSPPRPSIHIPQEKNSAPPLLPAALTISHQYIHTPQSSPPGTFQRGDEPRFVPLVAREEGKKQETGYEAFAHGPYTPEDSYPVAGPRAGMMQKTEQRDGVAKQQQQQHQKWDPDVGAPTEFVAYRQ